MTNQLTITNKAAEKIKQLLLAENKTINEWGLRIGVMGGGCSGFQYTMAFDKVLDKDNVIKHNGIQVFIDPRSQEYINGSLEYIESLMGSGFKIKNEKETGGCGCGQSFSV